MVTAILSATPSIEGNPPEELCPTVPNVEKRTQLGTVERFVNLQLCPRPNPFHQNEIKSEKTCLGIVGTHYQVITPMRAGAHAEAKAGIGLQLCPNCVREVRA